MPRGVRWTFWAVAAVAAFGGVLATIPACSEERSPGTPHAAASAHGKIGDPIVCAVDGMQMRLAADTPSAEYRGTVYYFCSDSEKQTFLKDPERYTKH